MSVTISVRCDTHQKIEVAPSQLTLYLHCDAPEMTRYEYRCPRCQAHYNKPLPDTDMHEALMDAGVVVHLIEWHPESFDPMLPPLNNDDLLDFINALRAVVSPSFLSNP